MRNGKKEYDLYKNKLLQLIKTKGILVKKMEKSDNFLVDAQIKPLFIKVV